MVANISENGKGAKDNKDAQAEAGPSDAPKGDDPQTYGLPGHWVEVTNDFGLPTEKAKQDIEARARDGIAQQALLNVLGVTNEAPYAGMDTVRIADEIMAAAGLTLEDVGGYLKTKQGVPVADVSRREVARVLLAESGKLTAAGEPENARRLAAAMKTLLNEKINAGLLDPNDLRPTAKVDEGQGAFKRVLMGSLGMKDPAGKRYRKKSVEEMVVHITQLLSQNLGLTQKALASMIEPESPGGALHLLRGSSGSMDKDFLVKFGAVVKPYLQKGAADGWLDPNTLDVRTFGQALAHNLPKGFADLRGKDGIEAAAAAFEPLGIPVTALGAILGHSGNFSSQVIAQKHSLYPADALMVAETLQAYIKAGKKWNEALEIVNPEHLKNHARMKEYLVNAIEEKAGKKIRSLHAIAERHSSVGPLIREIRTSFKELHHSDFPPMLPTIMSELEANRFNPNCMGENGWISEAHKEKFDHVAAVLGARYKEEVLQPADGVRVNEGPAAETPTR